MKTVHTFSVVFWLKKRSTRKDGSIPIYARITVDGIRADVSTKHAVLRSQWSFDTGRVRTKVNGAKSINDDLSKVYEDITYQKVRKLKKMIQDQNLDTLIEIDGGVTLSNAKILKLLIEKLAEIETASAIRQNFCMHGTPNYNEYSSYALGKKL